jgi:hypothetical protein
MSKTRCPRFVRSHLDRLNLVGGGAEGGHVAGGILSLALYTGGITSDAADAKGALGQRGEGGEGGCPRDQGPVTRLLQRRGWILSEVKLDRDRGKAAPTRNQCRDIEARPASWWACNGVEQPIGCGGQAKLGVVVTRSSRQLPCRSLMWFATWEICFRPSPCTRRCLRCG